MDCAEKLKLATREKDSSQLIPVVRKLNQAKSKAENNRKFWSGKK
jgi:hypothetical protein